MQPAEERKQREHVWVELTKLGLRAQERKAGTTEDLSEVAPHLLGRR